MTLLRLLSMASTLTLAACAVGPNYVAPTPAPAAAGAFVAGNSPALSVAPVDANWWRLYRDPVLDGLIDDALKANTDIRVAVARLEKARANLRGSRSDRLPQTGLSTGATYGRLPEGQRVPGAQAESWSIDAGLSVSYEVDLFGRVSRGVEAARGDEGAAAADADGVRVAVVADTTRRTADGKSWRVFALAKQHGKWRRNLRTHRLRDRHQASRSQHAGHRASRYPASKGFHR